MCRTLKIIRTRQGQNNAAQLDRWPNYVTQETKQFNVYVFADFQMGYL